MLYGSFTFGNSYPKKERTLSDNGAISGDTVMLKPNPEPVLVTGRLCRKSVIYLYPPSSLSNVSPGDFPLSIRPQPQATVPPGQLHTAQSLT